MKIKKINPDKFIKAFLKEKPKRNEIDLFKKNLLDLIDKINIINKRPIEESEEHLKNDIRDFLRDTYYKETNVVNTKDKKDLVIYLDKTTDSPIGVVIEAKRPSNVSEMITIKDPNKKALHELILYYLDERIRIGNNEMKQLVITNINEWYIIDANYFDKYIYNNQQIKKLYDLYINDHKPKPFFYQEILKIISKLEFEIPCVIFDISKYEGVLRNNNQVDDRKLISLYKILSPQYLLKIASSNDSNSLNEPFYKELLHIIGLEETFDGSKAIIGRKQKDRNSSSLIENCIEAISSEDVFDRIKNKNDYGDNKNERVYNIALELSITWINRILFLKLLEGQLFNYHQNKNYHFLNIKSIPDSNELFKLFHNVLAVKLSDRIETVKEKYKLVPYLNSSLFELTELEKQAINIKSLESSAELQFINTTVLKDVKKSKSGLPVLEYLFKFLDSFDFSSEETEDIQEENKAIINASVLGKVFEKINGFKDGSVYTPDFITMYMCRHSIKKTIIEKFNNAFEHKGVNFEKYEDLKNYISNLYKPEQILEANELINSIRICDPGVGSGHFLVSCLNSIINIKADLKLLADDKGNRISGFDLEIVNDELIITNQNGSIFEYRLINGKPINKDSQILQELFFHEKVKIIENCLFGVDINPNSVKICQLRLWIELLKNSYYIDKSGFLELETLPNIDINIKCGNSVISQFQIDVDLKEALKKVKYKIKQYKEFVEKYKNERNKINKQNLLEQINTFKEDIIVNIDDPFKQKIASARAKVTNISSEINRKKQWGEEISADLRKKLSSAKEKLEKLEKEKSVIISNIIYRDAFEWRFEFPELLNNSGEFEGFDLIIGNPPYISAVDMARNELIKKFFKARFPEATGSYDIYILFLSLGLNILKPNGNYSWIVPNKLLAADYARNTLNLLSNTGLEQIIDVSDFPVFKGKGVYPIIINGQKSVKKNFSKVQAKTKDNFVDEKFIPTKNVFTAQTLKDFGIKVMSGTTGFEATKIKQFVNDRKDGIKFTVSGNVDRYEYNNINVQFMKHKYAKAYICNDEEIAKSKWKFWNSPKVVVAGMTKVIEAVYVKEPLGIGVGCYAIYEFADFNPKVISGILNSKYFSYYLNIEFKDKHLAGGYLAINKSTIEALPWTDIDQETQLKLEELVDKVIMCKKNKTDSNEHEKSIDKLVYEIFDVSLLMQREIDSRIKSLEKK
jgi:adenine-specific DNA-methyltransferase